MCAAPTCGDDVLNGDEACDDGNTESYDGCSATCVVEEGHLLISEAVIEDDPAEFIEVHNPNDWSVNLEDYYLASTPTYYLFTTGMQPMLPEVVLGFPAGSTIEPRGFVVVSLENAVPKSTMPRAVCSIATLPRHVWACTSVPKTTNDPSSKTTNLMRIRLLSISLRGFAPQTPQLARSRGPLMPRSARQGRVR